MPITSSTPPEAATRRPRRHQPVRRGIRLALSITAALTTTARAAAGTARTTRNQASPTPLPGLTPTDSIQTATARAVKAVAAAVAGAMEALAEAAAPVALARRDTCRASSTTAARTMTVLVAVATGRTTPHQASSTTSLAQTRTGWIPTGTVLAASRHSRPIPPLPNRRAKRLQDGRLVPTCFAKRRSPRLPGGGCGSAPSAGRDYAPKLTPANPQPMPWIQTCWSPGMAASRSDADTIICALNDSSLPSPAR